MSQVSRVHNGGHNQQKVEKLGQILEQHHQVRFHFLKYLNGEYSVRFVQSNKCKSTVEPGDSTPVKRQQSLPRGISDGRFRNGTRNGESSVSKRDILTLIEAPS